jgi:hypothetical protein
MSAEWTSSTKRKKEAEEIEVLISKEKKGDREHTKHEGFPYRTMERPKLLPQLAKMSRARSTKGRFTSSGRRFP